MNWPLIISGAIVSAVLFIILYGLLVDGRGPDGGVG